MTMDELTLENNDLKAKINLNNGQLVSLLYKGKEYYHNGGGKMWDGKGWSNSEIIGFPVFGPVYGFTVSLKDTSFLLDQHGISRTLPFIVHTYDKSSVTLVQKYDGSKILNPKYSKEKGNPKEMSWLPYTLKKVFSIKKDSLVCTLTVRNDSSMTMPYMIGWHPAFNALGDIAKSQFIVNNKNYSFAEVLVESEKKPNTALMIPNANSATYISGNRKITLKSDQLKNIMLWSPGKDAGMFCIEPMTKLPVHKDQCYFRNYRDYELLEPGEEKEYIIGIFIE